MYFIPNYYKPTDTAAFLGGRVAVKEYFHDQT